VIDPWSDTPEPPEPPIPPSRSRWLIAVITTVALAAGTTVTVVAVRHGTGSVPATSVPGVTETPVPGACVGESAARGIWTDVSHRLDALVLHPTLSGVGSVATGTAAQQIRQYIQQTLLDKHLTEREQERLDALSVVQPGCNGAFLTIRATETLVRDDYLAADGHVDHVDAGLGQTHQLLESYQRTGSTWKVFAIVPLDEPTPSPSGQII